MAYGKTVLQVRCCFFNCAAVLAAILLVTSTGRAQDTATSKDPEAPWAEDLINYPGL